MRRCAFCGKFTCESDADHGPNPGALPRDQKHDSDRRVRCQLNRALICTEASNEACFRGLVDRSGWAFTSLEGRLVCGSRFARRFGSMLKLKLTMEYAFRGKLNRWRSSELGMGQIEGNSWERAVFRFNFGQEDLGVHL